MIAGARLRQRRRPWRKRPLRRFVAWVRASLTFQQQVKALQERIPWRRLAGVGRAKFPDTKVNIISVIGQFEGWTSAPSARPENQHSLAPNRSTIVLTLPSRMCPVCHSAHVSPSKRHGFLDLFMRVVGQKPVRCRDCNSRFYVPAEIAKNIRQQRKWRVGTRQATERDR